MDGELSDDAVCEIAERRGSSGEDFASDGITFVAKFAHEWKYAREDVIRIFYHPVEDASPFAAAEPLQHFRG